MRRSPVRALGSAALLAVGLLLTDSVALAAGSAQGDLARARLLYAAASYEEALALLPVVPAAAEADEVDRYKALCLLALDRTTDAEQALARVISRNPDYQIAADDSPRIVELFREVRRRVLPIRAESLYARAKVDLEDRQYDEAIEKFTAAIAILGDPDVGSVTHLQELRKVAEEFRRLAEERRGDALAGPVRPDGSARGATGTPFGAAAQPGSDAEDTGRMVDEPVYTLLSTQVKPPVDVLRQMPAWNPPADQAWRTFRGVIEVLVGRTGEVEQVRLLERLASFYDDALVEAAWGWTFEPARLDGRPVRFRHRIDVVIRPR